MSLHVTALAGAASPVGDGGTEPEPLCCPAVDKAGTCRSPGPQGLRPGWGRACSGGLPPGWGLALAALPACSGCPRGARGSPQSPVGLLLSPAAFWQALLT